MFSVLSGKSFRAPRAAQRKWLRAAVLGAWASLAGLLLWGSLGGDDSITEVLAHRGEVLPGRFVEVPCSEDYDSHRRFEGIQCCSCPRDSAVNVKRGTLKMHLSFAAMNCGNQVESGVGRSGAGHLSPPLGWLAPGLGQAGVSVLPEQGQACRPPPRPWPALPGGAPHCAHRLVEEMACLKHVSELER